MQKHKSVKGKKDVQIIVSNFALIRMKYFPELIFITKYIDLLWQAILFWKENEMTDY